MTTRIVCIGSRVVARDSAGPEVYDALTRAVLPPDVELVDGGLGGLDLLYLLDEVDHVVFVDAAEGFGEQPVVVLDRNQVGRLATPAFGHSAGLPYLLRVLPEVASGPLPSISIVAVQQTDRDAIDTACRTAIELATQSPPPMLSPNSDGGGTNALEKR